MRDLSPSGDYTNTRLKIAATGFVSEQAGSVASANAVLLREMLARGCGVHFFSKASFVDPRTVLSGCRGFEFSDVDNVFADRLRRLSSRLPILGTVTRLLDVATYNSKLVASMRAAHQKSRFDLCLWLGDYARGCVPGVPTVSFAQGPPGTDARSVIAHFDEIRKLAGGLTAWRWRMLARLRLSKIGLPPFHFSDHIVVGSSQSRRTLRDIFHIPESRTSSVPYPMDLSLFQPSGGAARGTGLRCLWLGRIVPRKRLDVFLGGLAEAVRRGLDASGTIIGGVGFIRGYERLVGAFPYPERLRWVHSAPRVEIPHLIRSHDVLVQPSEEEDFGSSVAEAQACGLPVIVGPTSGNADYLCARDIHLRTYEPDELAAALLKVRGVGSPADSRTNADKHYLPSKVAAEFLTILGRVAGTPV